MTISTMNLIATEKYLRLMRRNNKLTEDGQELLELVQNELVRRVNADLAYWHFHWKMKELKAKGNKMAKKLIRAKKARKVMIPKKKARKIRYCKEKGENRYVGLRLTGRRKRFEWW